MKRICAFVPWTFFEALFPFNAELLNGNAMVVRACGAKPRGDGSILRSKEYLLFGNGMATLLPQARTLTQSGTDGYVMEFVKKVDARQVMYWEVQSVPDQPFTPWSLKVARFVPDQPDDEDFQMLVHKEGSPGQYIFLARTA